MKKILAVSLCLVLLLAGCSGQAAPIAATASPTAQTTPVPTLAPTLAPTPVPEPEYALFDRQAFGGDEFVFSDMDLDGDGLADTLELRKIDYAIVAMLTLGSGAAYTQDMECMFFDAVAIADLTGDGRQELVIMGDTGGVGGAGCHNIVVLHVAEDGGIIKLPLPARDDESLWSTGFAFDVVYKDGFLMDVYGEELLLEDAPVAEHRRPMMLDILIYDADGRVQESRAKSYLETASDGFCDFEIIPYADGHALRMRQYVWSYGHADGIGMGVSVLRWDGQAFACAEQSFEPFAD